MAAASPGFTDNLLAPNAALDPPIRLSTIGNMTPKQMLRSVRRLMPTSTPASASAAMTNTRQPQFTPASDSIPEEVDGGRAHPPHAPQTVRNYMSNEQHRLQLSPPYVHEGMGDAESFFLWGVPSANALLLAAPDLGEPHFAQALLYAIHASNHSTKKGSSPLASPAMIYHNSTSYNG